MKEVKFGDNYQQKLEIPCYKQAHTYSLIGLLIFNMQDVKRSSIQKAGSRNLR